MGSQATAQQNDPGTDRQLPRPRRPGGPPTPLVPDALGRAVNRTDRLDALTHELREAGRHGRTSAWLAERLGVSARTVKRDVTALQQAGVPIRASSGPQGGYVIDSNGPHHHSLALTADETLAVIVGLQAVSDQPLAKAGRSAMSKILTLLSQEQRADVDGLANRIWIRPGEVIADPDESIREVLVRATRDHQVVLIDYEPDKSPPTLTRQVEPLGFAHSHGSWFFLAWCRDEKAGRWFRLDHITAVEATHETFTPRDIRGVFTPTPEQ
jgi:predicted DNA-binding transcriptional regulator YafY